MPGILIVDDNTDAADTLAMLLGVQGHPAHAVYSGPAALAAVATELPDLILVDLGMPEMDGFHFCDAFRSAHPYADTRLVALTGWCDPTTLTRIGATGFAAHLTKPADAEALARVLRALCHPK